MVNVKLTTPVKLEKRLGQEGEVVALDDELAEELIGLGAAVATDEKPGKGKGGGKRD